MKKSGQIKKTNWKNLPENKKREILKGYYEKIYMKNSGQIKNLNIINNNEEQKLDH